MCFRSSIRSTHGCFELLLLFESVRYLNWQGSHQQLLSWASSSLLFLRFFQWLIISWLLAGTNISSVGRGYTHGFVARVPSGLYPLIVMTRLLALLTSSKLSFCLRRTFNPAKIAYDGCSNTVIFFSSVRKHTKFLWCLCCLQRLHLTIWSNILRILRSASHSQGYLAGWSCLSCCPQIILIGMDEYIESRMPLQSCSFHLHSHNKNEIHYYLVVCKCAVLRSLRYWMHHVLNRRYLWMFYLMAPSLYRQICQ